jgi:cytochrome c2
MKGNNLQISIKSGVLAIAMLGMASAATAQATSVGDPALGAKVFKKCKACHKIGDGAKNAVGPALTGVIGRTAGTAAGYKYGKSMKAAGASGLVWTQELVAQYIENPTNYLREYLSDPKAKAKMKIKIKKESDRVNVAAYLATFSTN